MSAAARVLATPRAWQAAAGLGALLALYALTPGIRWHVVNMYHVVRDIYDFRNSSLDARAETVHGQAWRMMKLVRQETPPTARILLPTGPEHAPLNNRLWCAYYLYPRHLLQEKDVRGALKGQVDYVLVDRGWGLARAGYAADSIRGDESGVLVVR